MIKCCLPPELSFARLGAAEGRRRNEKGNGSNSGLCRVLGTKLGSKRCPQPVQHRQPWLSTGAGDRHRQPSSGDTSPPKHTAPRTGGPQQPQIPIEPWGRRGAALAPGHQCDERAGLSLPSSGERPHGRPPPFCAARTPAALGDKDGAPHPTNTQGVPWPGHPVLGRPPQPQRGSWWPSQPQRRGGAELSHGWEPGGGSRKEIEAFTPTMIRLMAPSFCCLQVRALSTCRTGQCQNPAPTKGSGHSCRFSDTLTSPGT